MSIAARSFRNICELVNIAGVVMITARERALDLRGVGNNSLDGKCGREQTPRRERGAEHARPDLEALRLGIASSTGACLTEGRGIVVRASKPIAEKEQPGLSCERFSPSTRPRRVGFPISYLRTNQVVEMVTSQNFEAVPVGTARLPFLPW